MTAFDDEPGIITFFFSFLNEIPEILIFVFICTSPIHRELQLSPHIKRHAPVNQFHLLCGLFISAYLFVLTGQSPGVAHKRVVATHRRQHFTISFCIISITVLIIIRMIAIKVGIQFICDRVAQGILLLHLLVCQKLLKVSSIDFCHSATFKQVPAPPQAFWSVKVFRIFADKKPR